MKLIEKSLQIPLSSGELIPYFQSSVEKELNKNEHPIRFVVTKTDDNYYYCELGVLVLEIQDEFDIKIPSIFDFRSRKFENTERFNAVLMIPTGIDAEIGGDSGDAGAVARFISTACDNLITHPNVVNAADINELPDNGLYVEGSILSRFIMGTVGLQRVRKNKIMLIIDDRVGEDSIFCDIAINAASAARVTLGADCHVIKMNPSAKMIAMQSSSSKRASGYILNFENIFNVLNQYQKDYDAVAVSSMINVEKKLHEAYFYEDMINPWGGVEAMLTHSISTLFDIQSAHAPMIETKEVLNLAIKETDPRKAPEAISSAYLHCVLKGLYKSPKIHTDENVMLHDGVFSAEDISCIIIPDGCVGLPILAAIEQGIPVISVKENKNTMQNDLAKFIRSDMLFIANNYLEAVGVMTALKAGISIDTIRRPIPYTSVNKVYK